MNEMTDEDRKQVLGEVLMDELKAIREGVDALPTRIEFEELREDVRELKSDMKVVKAVVTDQSKQIDNHENRLTVLERKAA